MTTTPSATSLDLDADSDAEQSPFPYPQEVDVPYDDEQVERFVDTIQERKYSVTTQVPIDEAALERKFATISTRSHQLFSLRRSNTIRQSSLINDKKFGTQHKLVLPFCFSRASMLLLIKA